MTNGNSQEKQETILKQMSELHDRIKNSKWRMYADRRHVLRYAEPYCNDFVQMLHLLWKNKNLFSTLQNLSTDYYHTFCAAINGTRTSARILEDVEHYAELLDKDPRELTEERWELVKDSEYILEYSLSALHSFLKDGILPGYITDFGGCQIIFLYHGETNKYLPATIIEEYQQGNKRIAQTKAKEYYGVDLCLS